MIENTGELAADVKNPRRITEAASAGLKASLKRFGDISGIVFNTRTSELVCGHQRIKQFHELYGEQPIEQLDAESGRIRTPDGKHYLNIRFVDWPLAKQRAANVAANSQKLAGQFTGDLTLYLLEAEPELNQIEPGAFDELLFCDLVKIDTSETAEEVATVRRQTTVEFDATESEGEQTPQLCVVVQCRDEEHQREVYEQLAHEGFECTLATA